MKKGFVSISVVYAFLIIFLVILSSILILYTSTIDVTNNLSKETKEFLNG